MTCVWSLPHISESPPLAFQKPMRKTEVCTLLQDQTSHPFHRQGIPAQHHPALNSKKNPAVLNNTPQTCCRSGISSHRIPNRMPRKAGRNPESSCRDASGDWKRIHCDGSFLHMQPMCPGRIRACSPPLPFLRTLRSESVLTCCCKYTLPARKRPTPPLLSSIFFYSYQTI